KLFGMMHENVGEITAALKEGQGLLDGLRKAQQRSVSLGARQTGIQESEQVATRVRAKAGTTYNRRQCWRFPGDAVKQLPLRAVGNSPLRHRLEAKIAIPYLWARSGLGVVNDLAEDCRHRLHSATQQSHQAFGRGREWVVAG